MPRFQMSLSSASDLIAYIRRLGHTSEPGVTTSAVRLGVVLSAPGSGKQVRNILLDHFAQVNSTGGIFGRRIELTFLELPAAAERQAEVLRNFLEQEQIFAIACADFTGAEASLAAVANTTGTPAFVGFADFPEPGFPMNPWVFYLDGGRKGELEALADFAIQRFGDLERPWVIASSADPLSHLAATWLQKRLGQRPSQMVAAPAVPSSPQLLFWLSSSPSSPEEWSLTAQGETFITHGAAGTIFQRAQAAAQLVTEALRRAGRDLTQSGLITALEGFSQVQSSFPSPVSFGPTRRIGSLDVRVVRLNSK